MPVTVLFSAEDAITMRGLLPPLQDCLVQDGSLDCAKLEALKNRYCEHYSLSFEELDDTIEHTFGRFHSHEYSLVCQIFKSQELNSLGTVFLVHGYFDHAGIYKNLIRFCLERRLAVVMIDLPGHGLSSGKRASIDSFDRYTSALVDCTEILSTSSLPKPWHLIGQSMGGAIILDLLLEPVRFETKHFEKIVLLGPLLRPKDWARSRIFFFIVKKFVQRLNRKFSMNSNDDTFLNFLKQGDKLQPKHLSIDWIEAMVSFQKRFQNAPVSERVIHIIQGSDDGTVDWKYNIPQFKKKLPNAKVHMIEKARHHLVNESVEYRDQIFSKMAELF